MGSTSMIKSRVLLVVSISLMLIGCATTSTTVSENIKLPTPNEDQGLMFFYRPAKMYAAVVSYDMNLNNQVIGKVKNGKYFYQYVDPGSYTLTAETRDKESLTLEVEAGKTYYIRCSIKQTMMSNIPTLKLVDESTGSSAVKRCKYYAG